MYRKKYGKMTFSAWLNAELEQSSLVWTVFVGALLAIACIAVRVVAGTPYRVMLELGIADLVPPVWLFSTLRLVALVTVGCAAGLVLGYRSAALQAEKYRGCMLFVLMAVLELCWYPTLFSSGLVFLSLLEAILMLFLCLAVTVSFFRISRFSGWLLLLHCLWLGYLLLLTGSIFLRN